MSAGTGLQDASFSFHIQGRLRRRHHRKKQVCRQKTLRNTQEYIFRKRYILNKKRQIISGCVNQNIYIELCCVGKDSFKRRCEEQQTIHKLISEGNSQPSVWGYGLKCKQFITDEEFHVQASLLLERNPFFMSIITDKDAKRHNQQNKSSQDIPDIKERFGYDF